MELSKNFEPKATEEKWTKHWKDRRYFNSKVDPTKKPFTIVIPPPNVTGVLHMGHTLNETVQDILVRHARMNGFNACWVPGSDHASIATEAKVVQMLKEKGIDKNDLTREEFLKYAFEWKEKYGGIIYNQVERLGCSVDWDRVSFTMDDHYYKAVIKVFVDLYNKGLIYRGARMINWDPAAKTALSDEEVEYKEVTGKLYYIRYKIVDSDEYLAIATQRPETIMGDTAVCVNPGDERYKHLKGKKVIVPLVNREVPIIFDEYVDKEFGTGVLKITPAHDINDYNLGLKHNLPIIDTLNEDGTLSEAAEVFIGLDRFEARKKAIEKLKKDGLLIKEEDYTTRLGFSQRTDAVVEPRISTQWFVKMKELAGPALKEVTEGRINIHPGDKFLATYKYWLENVKDWCISRQLWWGQRIPAWYDNDGRFVVAETEEKAKSQWAMGNGQSEDSRIHHSPLTTHLRQDEDVLDTWFSSWLWPIEVFKGITNPGNEDIKYYYPTSVLVTGQDIIFFWVARMIMAGMEYMKDTFPDNPEKWKPFSDVYFTGMVRDKQGRKMSKSLGNSPDLLELIDKYGADAVRFGIMISSPAGNDLLFDEASLEQGKFFNNKIWNALKLVRSWESRVQSSEPGVQSFAIDWFENRLSEVKAEVEEQFKNFKLSEALKTIYSLIWDDFCSWYLEWVKPAYEQPIDVEIYNKTVEFFEELMQLLHSFMPFITEEIYHLLKERKEGDDLTVKQMSKFFDSDKNILSIGQLAIKFIEFIRKQRTEKQLKNTEFIDVFVKSSNIYIQKIKKLIEDETNSNLLINTTPSATKIFNTDFIYDFEVSIEKTIDKDEVISELTHFTTFFDQLQDKLKNQSFLRHASKDLIQLETKKLNDASFKIEILMKNIEFTASFHEKILKNDLVIYHNAINNFDPNKMNLTSKNLIKNSQLFSFYQKSIFFSAEHFNSKFLSKQIFIDFNKSPDNNIKKELVSAAKVANLGEEALNKFSEKFKKITKSYKKFNFRTIKHNEQVSVFNSSFELFDEIKLSKLESTKYLNLALPNLFVPAELNVIEKEIRKNIQNSELVTGQDYQAFFEIIQSKFKSVFLEEENIPFTTLIGLYLISSYSKDETNKNE